MKRHLLVLAATVVLAACSRADDPASLVSSAKDYIAKRDYSASIIQLKNALQKEPNNAEARYLLGLASLENGDLVSAEVELSKARDAGLQSDDLQVALARTLMVKGEAGKVIAQFASAKASAPKTQAELQALVALARLSRGEHAAAKQGFDEALAIDPGNVSANLGAARLAALARDLPGALSRIDTALAASPSSYEAQALKAELLALQGDRPSAEKAYRDAIALAPRQLGIRVSLIRLLLRHRALDEAAKEAEALAGVAPRDPRTSYAKALVLVEQRKFPAAREALQAVLKAAPDHVPSLTLAGLAALETGAYPEAESHLRKAVFKDPQAIASKRLLATTHLRMGQNELALSEIKELVGRAGMDANVLAVAGEAYLANGDVAAAARHYEKANALSPKNSALQTRLAQVHLAAGDSARAIKELESVSASNPDYYQSDLALVSTYLRRREPDKALEAIQALEKKQPDNPLTHNLRGIALLLKQDAAGARASFERALQLQSTFMPAVANLVRLDLRDKNVAAATKRYEAVLKKEPTNEQALLGMAAMLRMAGADPDRIEKLLKQSVASNPTSANARTGLVNFYLRARDTKAALSAAQDAQAAMPNSAPVAQLLGVTQLAAGETRQAIASFTRLAELQPKSAEPHVHLGRAHMAAKQPEEAIKALRAALTLQPDLPTVQRDIAAIYVATKRHDDALREAKAVQAQRPDQPFGHSMEAEIYVAQRKWDLAEHKYREMLKKFDAPVLVARTHAAMEAGGKRPQADAMAEEWIKQHPQDATVLAYLGERDIAAKRYAAAVQRYRSALARDDDNAQILNNLAWASHQIKQADALEHAEQAHELAPNNAAIMDTLGLILADRGQTERGLELLGRAAELAPDAYRIRLNFAKVLLKAKRKSAARKELEVLAKLDSRMPVQKEAAALLAGL